MLIGSQELLQKIRTLAVIRPSLTQVTQVQNITNGPNDRHWKERENEPTNWEKQVETNYLQIFNPRIWLNMNPPDQLWE